MRNTKGRRFPIEVILVCIRWYAAYPLRYRHLEERMQERGVAVAHSSSNRWAIRFLPLLEKALRNRTPAVGNSWRIDATTIQVKGIWKYRYRAVDKEGKTVDFLLTAQRAASAARRCFEKAMRHHDIADKGTMDKSGAHQAALAQLKAERAIPSMLRQVKYRNHLVAPEQRGQPPHSPDAGFPIVSRRARHLRWHRAHA
jgi:putative transposase